MPIGVPSCQALRSQLLSLAKRMEFYLQKNGAQIGPYTEQQIRDMLKSGAASPGDFAWRDGMEDWEPLKQIISTTASPQPSSKSSRSSAPQPRSSRRALAIGLPVTLVVLVGLGWFGIRILKQSQANHAAQTP